MRRGSAKLSMSEVIGPAYQLTGKVLDDGWVIRARLEYDGTHTGGSYSVCYNVEKDGCQYFLKAFNLEAYVKGSGEPNERFAEMTRMVRQYEYEKSLSEFCKENGVSKVECIIANGVTTIDGDQTVIPYLIFERADGDVRKFISSLTTVNNAWRFKSLHDVAVGLDQLHRIGVYHQDVKPSNVLTYGEDSKLGDLGRAVRNLSDCPFLSERYWGDKTYMAPEVAYTSSIGKEERRMLLTDLYLLGSLITYYFVDVPFNGLLYQHINPERHFNNSSLTYNEVLEDLKEAYVRAIELIQASLTIDDDNVKTQLIGLIKGLCNPDIERRHHPSAGAEHIIGSKYGLERVISTLDFFHRKMKYKLRR